MFLKRENIQDGIHIDSKFSEKKICHGSNLVNSAEFKVTPILLIVENEINGLIETGAPKSFMIKNKNYNLIGFTNYFQKHFILKIFNNDSYFIIDNLNKNSSSSYFNNKDKFWIITKLFYILE